MVAVISAGVSAITIAVPASGNERAAAPAASGTGADTLQNRAPAWSIVVDIDPPQTAFPPKPTASSQRKLAQQTATSLDLRTSWAAAIFKFDAASAPVGTVVLKPTAVGRSDPSLTGKGHSLAGIASFYWQDQMTAAGERFNPQDLTAAHRTLPFGTRVRVTRDDTGNSVIVRINDRGPFKHGRVIDLSKRAAEDLKMTGRGLTKVSIEVLGR